MTAVVLEAPPALGVHDWTAEQYHADPLRAWGGSVSSTTLRHILGPDGSPARVRWDLDHPEHKDAYDFGSVAHRMILGKGEEIHVVDAGDWRTKAAQQARDDARGRGAVPVLRKDFARARRLMHAVLRHPIAGPLFRDDRAVSELSVLWADELTGRYCRAMLDRFPHALPGRRPLAVDLKTTTSVATRALVRTVVKYGYDQQAAHYLDGLATLPDRADAGFVFVFVESRPPHLVRVVQLAQDWLERGRRRNRDALALLDRCLDLNDWPGAPPGLLTLDPPGWLDTDRQDDIDL